MISGPPVIRLGAGVQGLPGVPTTLPISAALRGPRSSSAMAVALSSMPACFTARIIVNMSARSPGWRKIGFGLGVERSDARLPIFGQRKALLRHIRIGMEISSKTMSIIRLQGRCA